ncbi:MAG: DUF5104 domain-containing protein [Prevotella sp.]|nr:DUF5104 domain-containing protein [Prevotella sp.]
MKKIISVISIIAVLCSLSGCNRVAHAAESMKWEINAGKIANEQAEIILNCFKTGEAEELEAQFCKNISCSHNLKMEIEQAIEFIDGNIIDDGTWTGMDTAGEAVDDGEITKLTIRPSLRKVKTDTGKEYLIKFDSYLIYEKDINNVGMINVRVYSEEDYKGNYVLIGGDSY